MKKLICIIFASIILLSIFEAKSSNEAYITYLFPSEQIAKYCNGDDMDSAGFSKTITELHTTKIPTSGLSREDIAYKTVALASDETGLTTIARTGRNNYDEDYNGKDKKLIIIKGDTAHIAWIDGWAGVSIFLCAWQPLVEKNLLRLPGIKHVIWDYESH